MLRLRAFSVVGVSRCLVVAVCCLLATGAGRAEEPLAEAVTVAQVDLAASGARDAEGVWKAPSAEDIAELFRGGQPWVAGPMPQVVHGEIGNEPVEFAWRLAFKEPVAIGTVVGDFDTVRALRPEAPYPGDPADASQWLALEVQPGGGQPVVAALPVGFKTRGLLLTETATRGRIEMGQLRLLRERHVTVTRWAAANAKSEYFLDPAAGAPTLMAAANVLRGGEWRNAGDAKEGGNPSPPITDVAPTWFVVSWQEPQTIAGLVLRSSMTEAQVLAFEGQAGINPVTALPTEWKRQRGARVQNNGRGLVWITLPEPITTRGLKLLITGVDGRNPQVCSIQGMQVLSPLGSAPVPTPPAARAERPSFAVPYTLPGDGYVTIAIDDAAGNRVRNLVANTERLAGANEEGWDLKDQRGQFVEPGEYRFTALWHPPFRLRYEMTAYPNVTTLFPERAAWLVGNSGPDGWLADHSAPKSVTVAGDEVIVGAPVAESGVSLAALDLEGRKQWAVDSFAAFTGAHFMAADAGTVYVASPVKNAVKYLAVDPDSEAVWAVDTKTHQQRQVVMLQPTATRKRGVRGLEARDGRLYLSVLAKDPWLTSAAKGADVDLEASQPAYKPKRKPMRAYEVVPDPRNDFLRLFRLASYPSGYGNDHGLTYLESTHGPSGRQHIVLAFKKPVPLGSAVFPVPEGVDYKVKLSVLKPTAAWPPRPERNADWQDLEAQATGGFDCVPFPEGTETRALRVTFYKGEDDIFADLETGAGNGAGAGDGADGGLGDLLGGGGALDAGAGGGALSLGGGVAWHGQLEGLKLLRRRYRSVGHEATVRVNSGKVAADGSWDARRPADRIISEADPGIYRLDWATPQPLRGLAIKEIDGECTLIEVWTGPGAPPEDLAAGGDAWRQVGSYFQERRDLHVGFPSANPMARYLDGYVDFGETIETRSLRLRIVKNFTDTGGRNGYGPRVDREEPVVVLNRCRVYGVAPLVYIGGEQPVDGRISERVEVLDAKDGKLVANLPVAKPGALAFSPDGTLYAVSGTQIVRLDPAALAAALAADANAPAPTPLITDLLRPTALGVDPNNGQLFVYDAAPERRVVRVYSPAGEHLRDIGTPGGYVAGPWDPLRLNNIVDLDIDAKGSLWLVDNTFWPKRVAQFTTAGAPVKDIFGPTPYGGGGCLDPWDKTRLFLPGVEFHLDWDTGAATLKNLTWLGPHQPDQPIRIDGRTYLVTRFDVHGPFAAVGVVYLLDEATGKARMVAAMGRADSFEPFKNPALLASFGNIILNQQRFHWSDLNGDGTVQRDEITFTQVGANRDRPTTFNRDLGLQHGKTRYQVARFLPDGTPVYEEATYPTAGESAFRLDGGGFIHMADGDETSIRAVSDTGERLWTVESEKAGVHGLFSATPYFDGQIVAQFGYIGQETPDPAKGELGPFVVIHSNVGAWNIITADGLYAGDILYNYRRPGSLAWRFPEHERGRLLPNLTSGQEHFNGYFTRSFADGKYYAVAGHNHASVLEVEGIDDFKRLHGSVTVTGPDITAAQVWERDQVRNAVYASAPVYDCYPAPQKVVVDGSPDEWRDVPVASFDAYGGSLAFKMSYDADTLYLLFTSTALGPFQNSGTQLDRLFKTGAAVDLQISTDPSADAARRAPVAGDQRLLLARTGRDYHAMLYQAVVPGTPADQAWVVASPVGSASFDRVGPVPGAEVRYSLPEYSRDWYVEAAIPLKALGLVPSEGLRLRFDFGQLVTDASANAVVQRLYWANKATSIVADAPSEARLHPDLWGTLRFHAKSATALSEAVSDNPLLQKDPDSKMDDNLLKELEAGFE